MRFPVTGDISTKDGDGNQNARLTNTLAESKKNGTTLATVRPGLSKSAETTGNGNGIMCFGEVLVNVFGATLGVVEQAEPDYTHVISGESGTTIWRDADYVGTSIVGNGGTLADAIYKSDDGGATTSYVANVPTHLGGDMTPDLPNGLINKNGKLYLLSTYSIYQRVYMDNSDYGATWAYVGAPAVVYPCCVSGTNIYSLTVGELWDEEIEDVTGFTVQVHTTTDLTSVTASTSIQNILSDFVLLNGCMTVIDGVIHVLVASTYSDLLYHFKYQSGAWNYTTQALTNEVIPASKRCYEIGGKIYFLTINASDEVTLRRIDATTDYLETYYALGGVSVGSSHEQLIYNGTTLTVCLSFGNSMEYHHFSNIGTLSHTIITTAALDENNKYDFALIP